MTHTLYYGDRTYSSWSMRGWLLLKAFDIPMQPQYAGLYDGTLLADLAQVAPARQVPAMAGPDGTVVYDTLAMAETLADDHPKMWPAPPALRGLARSITAEMHASFGALRGDCAMNLEHAWAGFDPSDAVLADVDRIQHLWALALDKSGSDGWLFGDYSIADVFYAPIAARFAGHGITLTPQCQAYVDRHLNDPLFRQWRAMGLTKSYDPRPYRMDLDETPWPGPTRLAAKAVEAGPSVNALCPYSSLPVTHFLELDGRIFGFCNAFCRDKTVADPGAWPKFMDVYLS